MKTSVKRLLSLLCVVAVATATMASCKKDTDVQTSSEEYEIEYIYESEETDGTESEGTETNSTETGASSKDTSSKDTSSKDTSSKDTSSKDTSSKDTASVIKGSGSYHKWDYSSLKGKKVTFAMWTDYIKPYAESVIKTFEKETGMDFEYMNVPQVDYIKTVSGKIGTGTGPDVVIDNSDFPGSLQILAPCNDYVDLSDPIWDADYYNLYTINGKTYSIRAASCIFTGTNMLYYNKTLLSKAGVTSPADLYKAGNWNWDTFTALMKAYKNSSTKVKGTNPMYLDARYTMASIGADVFKYDPKTYSFSNNLNDPLVTKAVSKYAEWTKAGYSANEDILSGKAAMQLTFLTKKDVQSSNVTLNDLACVPAPDYDANNKAVKSVGGKGWGIAKGAQNPEGAGIFIKYYTDPNNYNANEFFINDEATKMFFEDKTSNRPSHMNVLYGVCAANGVDAAPYCMLGSGIDPSQVNVTLDAMKAETTARANKATKVLQDFTK